MTFKKIILAIIFVPIAVVMIAFIVANRTQVALTLNPFKLGDESLTYHAPFALWLFIFLSVGIFIGGIATWFTQHKYRKQLRETRLELLHLKTITSIKEQDISIR